MGAVCEVRLTRHKCTRGLASHAGIVAVYAMAVSLTFLVICFVTLARLLSTISLLHTDDDRRLTITFIFDCCRLIFQWFLVIYVQYI